MFPSSSERRREERKHTFWERPEGTLIRGTSAAESSDSSPNAEQPTNCKPDLPEPYRLSSPGVGDITQPAVLTMLECCEMRSGSGG
jgi:hypothetical protein